MAKCKSFIPETAPSYRLELTNEEAQTLRCILCKIGGPAVTTARRDADNVDAALHEAGVMAAKHNIDDRFRAIYFTNRRYAS